MGLTKHLIPKQTRAQVVEAVDKRMPEGFVRRHSANAITFGGAVLVATGAKIGGR